METTLTLSADVANRARATAARLGKPFEQVVNEALRLGLDQLQPLAEPSPYHTNVHAKSARPAEGESVADFDRWLDELSAGSDGSPSLPANFSIADIYADHD